MGSDKIVVAHRGANGYLPEHTIPAYAMAHAQNPHFIEPDLVRTKDGHFICLHDVHLEATTDVEEKFPDRKRKGGHWYAIDFTLEEIRTLNVHERLPGRFPMKSGHFLVPTFEDVIELVQGLNQSTGREVGIYPELKQPAFHAKEGQPMEADFLAIVEGYGYEGPDAPIFIQCFEHEPLKKLRHELGTGLPLIQLIAGGPLHDGLATRQGLDKIAEYADGIGPDKNRVEENPDLVDWAHERGLEVHPYTIRRDRVPPKYDSTEDELRQFYFKYDVDGLFTDYPDDAVRVLNAHTKASR